MSLEGWKALFEIGGVILLGVTFVFGTGALYFSHRVNTVQEEHLRQFDKDLTDAKIALSEQQTRAAMAEKELLELKERIKPRRLTDEESARFIAALKSVSNGAVTLGTTA